MEIGVRELKARLSEYLERAGCPSSAKSCQTCEQRWISASHNQVRRRPD